MKVKMNKGLKDALQEEFMQELQISEYDPQFTVAIGAAIEASQME
jgi:activator of 2-hydroxyglutaryl-CoA dehydratase